MLENEVYEGIPELLSSLVENGFKLWVATSKPTAFAAPIVEHFKLSTAFSGVYGSELDGTRSDKAALIRHLLHTEGIAPDSALMVGDREHDVMGATANAVSVIGVTWGYGTSDELAAAGARRVVDTPAQLGRLIAG